MVYQRTEENCVCASSRLPEFYCCTVLRLLSHFETADLGYATILADARYRG